MFLAFVGFVLIFCTFWGVFTIVADGSWRAGLLAVSCMFASIGALVAGVCLIAYGAGVHP